MATALKWLLAGTVVALVACSSPEVTPGSVPAQQKTATLKEKKLKMTPIHAPIHSYQGTIRHISLEGGFYGIVTDKGLKLLPLNLAKQYRQDGAIIEFSGEYAKNLMTIQQWGKPFSIKEIKLIKTGKPGNAVQK